MFVGAGWHGEKLGSPRTLEFKRVSFVMIPDDIDELNALAGEYVLGLLEPEQKREVEQALPENEALRSSVAFWENRLHPLSELAPAVEPPAEAWTKIAGRLELHAQRRRMPLWWNDAAPWRWATGGFAALAAALLIFIALPSHLSTYVAVLEGSKSSTPGFIVAGGPRRLIVREIAGVTPPQGRSFEVWAIFPNVPRPQALGVMPANGVLRVSKLPTVAYVGATLAVSVEPIGGSPTGQPTGPVVFSGTVRAM
jgi:anti-sigma-K factor RskA